MKYCNTKTDVPAGEHYAIVEFSTIHIPGDERSRQFPGHGYPATSEPISRYVAFTDRAEWEAEISSRMKSTYSGKNFIALKVSPVTIETEIVIKLK
jgi:hypothetical protein